MKLNEKYFLNSLLSVAPRCALAPATLRFGAYNTAYAVRGSARPSPISRLYVGTSHTLERCTKCCQMISKEKSITIKERQ